MSNQNNYEYSGTEAYRSKEEPYLPAAEVVEAVNLALFLGRPLLLKGEPGCGKTRLALAVAYELALRHGVEKWPFEFWPVKSTSRARDGLYTFDAIGRLRDAQMATVHYQRAKEQNATAEYSEPSIEKYVQYRALGKAIKENPDQRTIVLIDEIDKADIDFPNDLLIELDELRFTVDELPDNGQREFAAKAKPIVLITSNDEKELPDAFLRRCIFLYIDFPPDDTLLQILIAHCWPQIPKKAHAEKYPWPQLTEAEKQVLFEQAKEYLKALKEKVKDAPSPGGQAELLARTLFRFLDLRQTLKDHKGEAGKRVSTSELIDWFKVLLARQTQGEDMLTKLQEDHLPFVSVLLKNRDDYRLLKS
jgi:MoxR-like ATPase